jgi:hypothetical protein
MSKQFTLNDNDRAQWIDNDEFLYLGWRSSGRPKKAYVKEHRTWLTEYIMKKLNQKPAN